MTKPNLLVIGAQKSGTTWLHHYLNKHPSIFMSKNKELSFFDNKILNEENLISYFYNFKNTEDHLYKGESTPGYFFTNHKKRIDIPKKIKDVLGTKTKFILILRNPIDRAISAYFHHFKFGRINPNLSFRDNLNRVPNIMLIGNYKYNYENWIKHFSEKNILTLFYEELKKNENIIKNKTLKWLGLNNLDIKIDKGKEHKGFNRILVNQNITVDLNSKKNLFDRFLHLKELKHGPVINQEDIEWLYEYYLEDIKYFEKKLLSKKIRWDIKDINYYA